MNKIQILPDNIINQIAAGEVIENPSAVVKELIENSIDSGASDIKIVIKKGGHSLVQVSDNGCGFSKEDLQTGDPSLLPDMLDVYLGDGFEENFNSQFGKLGAVASTGLNDAKDIAVFNAATAFRRSLDKPTSQKIRVASQAIGGEISLLTRLLKKKI